MMQQIWVDVLDRSERGVKVLVFLCCCCFHRHCASYQVFLLFFFAGSSAVEGASALPVEGATLESSNCFTESTTMVKFVSTSCRVVCLLVEVRLAINLVFCFNKAKTLSNVSTIAGLAPILSSLRRINSSFLGVVEVMIKTQLAISQYRYRIAKTKTKGAKSTKASISGAAELLTGHQMTYNHNTSTR